MSDFNSNLAMAMNELQSMRADTQQMMQSLQPANVIGSGASVSAPIHNTGALTGTITTSAQQQPFEYKPIQGEMFTVRNKITMEMWEDIPHEQIKRQMLSLIVEELMKSKHIEFTMKKDNAERDTISVAARLFVVPDSQVRLLRENGY